jgi:23S rRNA pseudouridine2605 synthase
MTTLSLVAYLARAGAGSRRFCDELVRQGRVAVNGETVTFPRQQVTDTDTVSLDGAELTLRALRYVLVNKPRGVASTRSDPHAERVLVELVPDGRVLFPVGRLDVETSGLIILTNDGPLANYLMHPRYGVPKTYVARVRGKVPRRVLGQFRTGIELEEGLTAPADAKLLKQSAKTALVEVVLHEGRKRQVRRMFAAVGLPVEDLHRRRYGPLTDKNLKVGDFRELSGDEVDALRRAGERVLESVDAEPEEHAVTLAAAADNEPQRPSSTKTAAGSDGASPAPRADEADDMGTPVGETDAAPRRDTDAGEAGTAPGGPLGPDETEGGGEASRES